MALDMFIKIGDIAGESKDSAKGGQIDVLAWSWGVSNSGSAHSGGGGGAGKANVQDLSFTKYVDKASPDLLLASCNGDHYTSATLVVRKAGTNPLEYLTITMSGKVLVTSVSTGGSGGEDRLTENVSLNFSKVKFDYIEQSETGDQGDTPSMGWDIAGNVKM